MRIEVFAASPGHPVLGQAIKGERGVAQVMGPLKSPWTWAVVGHEIAHLLVPDLWSGNLIARPEGLAHLSRREALGHMAEELLAWLLAPACLAWLAGAVALGRVRVRIIHKEAK